MTESTLSDTILLTSPQAQILHKQFQQLETKYSNVLAYRVQSHSSH